MTDWNKADLRKSQAALRGWCARYRREIVALKEEESAWQEFVNDESSRIKELEARIEMVKDIVRNLSEDPDCNCGFCLIRKIVYRDETPEGGK